MIQEQIEKLRTLQESYNNLADEISVITSRSVKYDKQTGNLTIENVELIIE